MDNKQFYKTTFNHSLLGRNAEHCPRNSNEMCVRIFFVQKNRWYAALETFLPVCMVAIKMFRAFLMLRIRIFDSRFLVLIWDLDIWYGSTLKYFLLLSALIILSVSFLWLIPQRRDPAIYEEKLLKMPRDSRGPKPQGCFLVVMLLRVGS